MSTPLEGIVGPFIPNDVGPVPYTNPGAGSHPMVRLSIGAKGAIKTLGWTVSITETYYMGQKHAESTAGGSQALQDQMSKTVAKNNQS
jgi:hypothetical protein